MRIQVAVLGALLIAWSALPSNAKAQMACGARNEFVQSLEKGFAETPISVGLGSNGSVIEVFSSDTGTFSILMTSPNGLSCFLIAGDRWEDKLRSVPPTSLLEH